jgi:hypothetical protein
MRVRYQKVTTTLAPYYICSEEVVRRAGTTCQSIRGTSVDEAVGQLLLETLAPATLEIAIAVQDEIAGRIEQADQLRRSQLERSRYEAELARRRYLKVDPICDPGKNVTLRLLALPPPHRKDPGVT